MLVLNATSVPDAEAALYPAKDFTVGRLLRDALPLPSPFSILVELLTLKVCIRVRGKRGPSRAQCGVLWVTRSEFKALHSWPSSVAVTVRSHSAMTVLPDHLA